MPATDMMRASPLLDKNDKVKEFTALRLALFLMLYSFYMSRLHSHYTFQLRDEHIERLLANEISPRGADSTTRDRARQFSVRRAVEPSMSACLVEGHESIRMYRWRTRAA